MERTCLKCGRVNPEATGSEGEPCPGCGAIYAKVEASLAAHERAVARARPARPLDLVALRRTLAMPGPGPDVALTPAQLMAVFTPAPARPPGRRLGGLGWSVFLMVLAGFLAMSGVVFQRMGEVDVGAADKAPPPRSGSPVDIDPRALLQDMRANPSATVAHWKGHDVRLRAPVFALAENPYNHRIIVKFHSGDPRTPIQAEMLPEFGPTARELAIAGSATVVCSTTTWVLNRPVLKGCELSS